MIRRMQEKDLDRILDIERCMHVSPWGYNVFSELLKSSAIGLVLEDDDYIVAYCVFQMVHGETTLLNIAVEDQHQGKGYARDLMHEFFEMARAHGCEEAFLEVRESNDRALRLYEYLGFEQVGFRKDYYPSDNGREHAMLYMRQL